MIILLTGLPGSGKTEVAKFLQKKIPASLILRNDVIRHELFGVEGGKGYSEDQKQAVDETVIQRAKDAIASNQTVILDRVSPTIADREMIKGLAESLNSPSVLISVSSPESLIKQRIEERLSKDALGIPFSVYQYWADKYEPVVGADYEIINDGDLASLEKNVDGILKNI